MCLPYSVSMADWDGVGPGVLAEKERSTIYLRVYDSGVFSSRFSLFRFFFRAFLRASPPGFFFSGFLLSNFFSFPPRGFLRWVFSGYSGLKWVLSGFSVGFQYFSVLFRCFFSVFFKFSSVFHPFFSFVFYPSMHCSIHPPKPSSFVRHCMHIHGMAWLRIERMGWTGLTGRIGAHLALARTRPALNLSRPIAEYYIASLPGGECAAWRRHTAHHSHHPGVPAAGLCLQKHPGNHH